MTVRNIKKNLAGAEDLLHGIGVETQSRGGAFYDMHKLDTYVPTYDVTEMQRSSLTFMRLYGTDTAYTDYRRNPAGTVGIPSDLGGVWEPIRSSELPVCGSFIYGAYVFSSDCIVGYNDSFMQWQGNTPKVVAAGATPATSGGIGAGAWVDRTDIALSASAISNANGGSVQDFIDSQTFANVDAMLAFNGLKVGQNVKTLGYYEAGDGGGAEYITSTIQMRTSIPTGSLFLNKVDDGYNSIQCFGGFNGVDCTDIINNALQDFDVVTVDSDVTISLTVPDPFHILVVPSNTTLQFIGEGKITLNPTNSPEYSMIYTDASNVRILNPNLVGDRYTTNQTTGEFGYGLNIRGGASDVYVENARIGQCFGDSIFINSASNIRFVGETYVYESRRQGVSVVAVDGLYIAHLKAHRIYGTDPEAAIDFEPNSSSEQIKSVRVDSIMISDCRRGVLFAGPGSKEVSIGDVVMDGGSNSFVSQIQYLGFYGEGDASVSRIDCTINSFKAVNNLSNPIVIFRDLVPEESVNIRSLIVENDVQQNRDSNLLSVIQIVSNGTQPEVYAGNIGSIEFKNCDYQYNKYLTFDQPPGADVVLTDSYIESVKQGGQNLSLKTPNSTKTSSYHTKKGSNLWYASGGEHRFVGNDAVSVIVYLDGNVDVVELINVNPTGECWIRNRSIATKYTLSTALPYTSDFNYFYFTDAKQIRITVDDATETIYVY